MGVDRWEGYSFSERHFEKSPGKTQNGKLVQMLVSAQMSSAAFPYLNTSHLPFSPISCVS